MNKRQKQFLLVFIPLAVLVLVAWYVLFFASDDSGAKSMPEKKSPVEFTSPEEEEPRVITGADREATKDIALGFMRDYLTETSEEKMRDQMTPDAFARLANEERPVVEIQKLEATRVENHILEQTGKLSWTVWVTIPRGKNSTYEVAYDVILQRMDGNWRVEGVLESDYPELRD